MKHTLQLNSAIVSKLYVLTATYIPELVTLVSSLTLALQGLNTLSYTGQSISTKLKG